MPKALVVCTVGLKGSGKSVLNEAASELGYQVISLGEVVRRELASRQIQPTDANMRSFSIEIRQKMGSAAVAILSEKLVKDGFSKVMFDGLRSPDEYAYFKQRYGECVLIAVHASPKTRFERIAQRGKPDDPKTLEEFKKRDEVELSFGLGSLLALADYHLVNDGITQTEFKKLCLDLLRRLCADKVVEA